MINTKPHTYSTEKSLRSRFSGPFAGLMLLVLPVIAYAQNYDFKYLVEHIILDHIFDPLVVLIVAIALVYFIWGVTKYIAHGGDETKRAEGQQMMINGIIALFVIVSVWGLVAVLQNTFFPGSAGGGSINVQFQFSF